MTVSALRTLIIVPAFNESAAIGSVIESLAVTDSRWDILVVNDCSTDETSALARTTGKATVIDLCCNLGIGGAVQTGLKFAYDNGYKQAIQFDGDGQHRAGEIAPLLDALCRNEADVTVGSRFLDESRAEFRSTRGRRIGIRLLSGFVRLLTGAKIADITSGFRAFNGRAIALLAEEYPVDYPEPEVVVILAKYGLKVKEIPVVMSERAGGISSISGIKSVYYMIKVMLALVVMFARRRG
jgi:glycosyltransferase involved in cell wall biosynthesis